MRALNAQLAMELRLTLRRGENLLVTLGIPLVLLAFLASVPFIPAPANGTPRLDELVPGILCLALISTGLVSLGIATAFERGNGTLKRLAGSPLATWALVAAKTGAVAATAIVQVLLLAVAAALLGWAPGGGAAGLLAAAPWLLLGTVCSAAGGLLMAGLLRPEATLAVANGLYLLILLLGGVVVPLADLPAPVGALTGVLPPALMADLVRGALTPGGTVAAGEAVALSAWTVALVVATLITFRPAEA